MLTMTTKSRAR